MTALLTLKQIISFNPTGPQCSYLYNEATVSEEQDTALLGPLLALTTCQILLFDVGTHSYLTLLLKLVLQITSFVKQNSHVGCSIFEISDLEEELFS